MPRIHLDQVPWQEQRSPSGKFHSFAQNIFVALGCPRNAGLSRGGHPFDVQIRRIPSGASVCPYHLHLAQWELFVVRAGHGRVRAPDGETPVKSGDVFFHPPGTPHQLTGAGPTDLEVLIITDNPQLDSSFYPDSDKWPLRPPGKLFRITETDYFDGEDTPVPGATAFSPAPPPAATPVAPFASRLIHLDAVPLENWESPGEKIPLRLPRSLPRARREAQHPHRSRRPSLRSRSRQTRPRPMRLPLPLPLVAMGTVPLSLRHRDRAHARRHAGLRPR